MLSSGCNSLSRSLGCQRRPLSHQASSNGALVGGGWLQLSLSFSPCQASLPPSLPPLPSLGLCRWLNAGILSQRLPVARRAGAPEKLGKCMWVTASQAGAFHSPLPSFFSSFLCLCSSLAPSVSAPERADIVVCRPRYFQMIFLDGALRLRPSRLLPSYYLVSISVFVSDSRTNRTVCTGPTQHAKKDLEQMFHCPRSHFLSAAPNFFFLFLFLPSVSLASCAEAGNQSRLLTLSGHVGAAVSVSCCVTSENLHDVCVCVCMCVTSAAATASVCT